MASYIPQVTDFIPTLQPFRADLNYYSNVLQAKQSAYDQAHKQISQAYGTLLNAPMLRDGNIQRRDQFFKNIEQNVKKISKLDLSQEHNVSAAMSAFKPIYDDKYIIKDMVYTKQLQNEMARAENFRNCVDPDKCGGQYWEEGVKALHYQAQEFKNASDDDSLSMSAGKYVPYVNVTDKAFKLAKDMGFNITSVTNEGNFIVTHKNGAALTAPLYSYFVNRFKDDPSVKGMYDTMSYVKRNDWVSGNIDKFGSKEAAENAYYNTVYGELEAATKNHLQNAEDRGRKLNAKSKALANSVNNSPGKHEDDPIVLAYQNLQDEKEQNDGEVSHHKTTLDLLTKNPRIGLTPKQAMAYLDKAVSNGLFLKDMQNAAMDYSALNSEEKWDTNQFALESMRHKNSLQLEAIRNQHENERLMYKIDADKQLAIAKGEIRMPTADELKLKLAQDKSGSGATSAEDYDELKEFTDRKDELTTAYNSSAREYLSNVFNFYKTQIEQASAPNSRTADSKQWFLQQYASIFGKPYQPGNTFDSAKISPSDYSRLYQNAVKFATGDPLMDKGNQNKLSDISRNIDKVGALKNAFYRLESKNNANLVSYLMSDPNIEGGTKKNLALMLNRDGSIKTPDQFVSAYESANPRYSFGKRIYYDPENIKKVYDQTLETYKKHYNAGYSAGTGVPVVQSWKTAEGIAPYAEGLASRAVQGRVDSANKNTPNMNDFRSVTEPFLTDNYVAVLPGGPLNKEQFKAYKDSYDNPGLKQLAKEFINQMSSSTAKDDSRPSGEFRVQAVAANDPNLVAVTVYPNENWAKKYAGSEYGKDDKGRALTYDKSLYQNGITIYMNKNAVKDNPFFKNIDDTGIYKSIVNLEPYTVEKTGGGRMTFTKTQGGYQVNGFENAYENGEHFIKPINNFLPGETDLETVIPYTEQYLEKKANRVVEVENAYNLAHPGPIKNVNQLQQ